MEKTITDYLKLPYTRELIPDPSGGWFIRIKELPGCMSQGETAEEALAMIEEAMFGWIEAELAMGNVIPEPSNKKEFSGKFVLRIPKYIHRELANLAEEEGISLNQLLNTLLAEAVGKARVLSGRTETTAIESLQALEKIDSVSH
ncbi:MAG: toxin-antitoxin system HicB family antitoxin [Chloroflexota bacterium]